MAWWVFAQARSVYLGPGMQPCMQPCMRGDRAGSGNLPRYPAVIMPHLFGHGLLVNSHLMRSCRLACNRPQVCMLLHRLQLVGTFFVCWLVASVVGCLFAGQVPLSSIKPRAFSITHFSLQITACILVA